MSARRKREPRHMGRRGGRWTREMDTALAECVAMGLGMAASAARMEALGFGARSPDTLRARAERLELRPITFQGDEGPLDCRRDGEADPLLLALAAAHKTAPMDAVPPPADGRALNWRRLVPSAGSAGSPAALCAAEGDTANWS